MLIQRVGGVRDGGMSDKQRTPGRGKKRMRSLCPSVYCLVGVHRAESRWLGSFAAWVKKKREKKKSSRGNRDIRD